MIYTCYLFNNSYFTGNRAEYMLIFQAPHKIELRRVFVYRILQSLILCHEYRTNNLKLKYLIDPII